MQELITNLHMHTIYSDGTGSHQDIAKAALRAGLDVVITTDHNVLVQGIEGYHQSDQRRVLLLVGEEVHDRTRSPQKNHLLVIGAQREMSNYAPNPQNLIDQVYRAGGLSFIAHPNESALKMFGEDDISWVDWEIRGFTGIELWNNLSEFKTVSQRLTQAVFHAFFPQYMAHAPLTQTLKKWDELTAKGQKVVAVGGSDAHALKFHAGPIQKTLYPYHFHFQCINNHLLVEHALTDDFMEDRRMVLNALKSGHSFIGYDLPASTRGFRFTAQGMDKTVSIGDEIRLGNGVTLQIRMPEKAECRLVSNGKVLRTWKDREICAHVVAQPGVYRVECYREYLGETRGWIFSNPIYVLPNR